MRYKIRPLTRENAQDIVTWRYPAPYDFYDPPEAAKADSYIEQFLITELQFHGIWDDKNNFIGFCSFGIDGQIIGGDYSEPGLDIGLGMKPDLIDQGRGRDFFRSILDFAMSRFQTNLIRLTVASFNHRALFLYQKFAFTSDSQFIDPINKVDYSILVLKIKD